MTRSETRSRPALSEADFEAAVDEAYDAVLALLVESESYLSKNLTERVDPPTINGLAVHDRAFVISQKMRITTRLSSAMAWLLMRRAVEAGEIAEDAPLAEAVDPFDNASCCLDTDAHADGRLSRKLRELLDRSYRLYVRVVEMDTAMRGDPALAH